MKKQSVLVCLIIALVWCASGCGGGGKFSQNQPTVQTPQTPQPTTQGVAQGIEVTLQSPTASATNPVSVQATATSAKGVAGWAVYADDTPVYQATQSSTSLSTQVSLSAGQHVLYVRAWDPTGANGTSPSLSVQVGGGSATTTAVAAASALPIPPANATVLDNIQNTTDGWSSCSACAQGTNLTSNYWMAPFITTPSRSGSSRELFIDGPSWSNALFSHAEPGHSSATHFLWDFWVYHDGTSAANIWAAEFDLFQAYNGREFMIGSQCNFGTGVWDLWNSVTNHWEGTSARCPRWAPDTWHHIQWWVERVGNQYRYNTLVVDGKATAFNKSYDSIPRDWDNAVGVQWQLDQNSTGVAIHEWIDNVKLTMW